MSSSHSSKSDSSSSRSSRYTGPESTPFLSQDISGGGSDLTSDFDSDIENGVLSHTVSSQLDEKEPLSATSDLNAHTRSKWRVPFLRRFLRRSRRKPRQSDKSTTSTVSRKTLRIAVILLMIVGILNLLTVWLGFGAGFNSEDDDDYLFDSQANIPDELKHWPTDTTADIHPIACHSHNDYWRKEPLFTALSVGCQSVEADIWLYNNDLYVGHSASSLTKSRTLRSLYVDPLQTILDKQNPVSEFHPDLDKPRNGIFDTDAEQSLILLIDFKTDGDITFDSLSSHLEPLRQRHYLTHFNGSHVIQGPTTVVLTGNAPWNRVVESTNYRDMFFDAPLDLMYNVDPDSIPVSETTDLSALVADGTETMSFDSTTSTADDQGQGRSGAAPTNPAAYSPANSYFASVDFKKALFHKLPLPWQYPFRGTLTDEQIEIIRKQIRGAHLRGLKVRYWGVPDWPRGLRNYLWRVMITEGIDYLNADDLWDAKKGGWFNRWEDGVGNWWGGRRKGHGRGGRNRGGPQGAGGRGNGGGGGARRGEWRPHGRDRRVGEKKRAAAGWLPSWLTHRS